MIGYVSMKYSVGILGSTVRARVWISPMCTAIDDAFPKLKVLHQQLYVGGIYEKHFQDTFPKWFKFCNVSEMLQNGTLFPFCQMSLNQGLKLANKK